MSACMNNYALGGILAEDESGKRYFTTDMAFFSSSAAAAVVAGRSANGRLSWLVEGKGMTYGAWQEL